MESYYGFIFMKRTPVMPGTSLEPPMGSQGSPGHAPSTPGDAPGTPKDAPGTPGDAPGHPRDRLGPLMDHKNNHISTNIQRQKLSVAVFEPASWDPSHDGLDWTGLSIKRPPKINKLGGDHPMGQWVYP